ncbi:MAG: hypothetical protein ACLTWO_12310 [Blautia massiliensis (ex Durand et al. 2017)]
MGGGPFCGGAARFVKSKKAFPCARVSVHRKTPVLSSGKGSWQRQPLFQMVVMFSIPEIAVSGKGMSFLCKERTKEIPDKILLVLFL